MGSRWYLQPEPLLSPTAGPQDVEVLNALSQVGVRLSPMGGATLIKEQAAQGVTTPTYAYANSNPVANHDPDGLTMVPGQMTNPPGPFQNNPPPGWGGPRPPPGPGPGKAGSGDACKPMSACTEACDGAYDVLITVCKMLGGKKARALCYASAAASYAACLAACP